MTAVVNARARQGQIKGAGHCRFRPTGIGRTVITRIPHHRLERRSSARVVNEKRRCDKCQTGETSCRPIGDIIKARRGPAEGAVLFVLITNHTVERINRFVSENTRQTGQNIKENWRDKTIAEIFRRGFDGRPRDAGLIERVRVSADDMFHRRATALGFSSKPTATRNT